MAIDYISVTRTGRPQLGSQLVSAANKLREIRDLIDALTDAAGHMNDGSNYATLEANFGLTTGAGANFASLLQGIQDALNTNATIAGQARLDKFDEFVARLAGQ